jgi:hypothetical protein
LTRSNKLINVTTLFLLILIAVAAITWILSYRWYWVAYRLNRQGTGWGLWSDRGAIYILRPGAGKPYPSVPGWQKKVVKIPRANHPMMEDAAGTICNRWLPFRTLSVQDQFQRFPVDVIPYWLFIIVLSVLPICRVANFLVGRNST